MTSSNYRLAHSRSDSPICFDRDYDSAQHDERRNEVILPFSFYLKFNKKIYI